jgi:hypothetical protein
MGNRDFRKVKNISKDLEQTYVNYFNRNISKFFTKWRFSSDDLDKKFLIENEEFKLKGQVADAIFFIEKIEDGSKWFINGDLLKSYFFPA